MSCPWNNDGKIFGSDCPFMLHSLYPYFLGLVFNARFSETGECKVCCPAEHGVDTIIKMNSNEGQFPMWVPREWRDVIHAEVVNIHGHCEYAYRKGDKIVFPTCLKGKYRCPAGTNNIFPFLQISIPSCINKNRLRCPDWAENIYYSLEE